jgi:hypothetical protein
LLNPVTEQGADRVECYSGHTYPQEPRVVVWQGRRLPVVRIARRWRTPEGPAFSVGTDQGLPFELHYSELGDVWTIQPLAELDSEAPGPGDQAEDRFAPDSHNQVQDNDLAQSS